MKAKTVDFLQCQSEYMEKCKTLLKQRFGDCSISACIVTFGCQQNVNDGEKIKGMAAKMGFSLVSEPSDAQLIIYNTCAVREGAQDKVFGNIGELKHIKEQNPDTIIGLCGCMTQQQHVVDRIKRSYPQIDIVFGTHTLSQFPKTLYDFLSRSKRTFNVIQTDGQIDENLPIVHDESFRANLSIMYGCDNFCTYCIVPYVRGRERSRSVADIMREAKALVDSGCKEITLLGQNVNSYGKGNDEVVDFPELLYRINSLDGDFRVRFMTSHPKDAKHELFDAMANCEKVCAHIHLPVQSGSDRVLKLMNRGYTQKDYLELVEYARKKVPDISLSSDIIVGFPGETEQDFMQTVELIKKVGFDNLFTFIYSKRPGTKAALMEDVVSEKEKSAWFDILLKEQHIVSEKLMERFVGTKQRILIDSVGKTNAEYVSGRTEHNAIVDIKGDKSMVGKWADVEIEKSLRWALVGKII